MMHAPCILKGANVVRASSRPPERLDISIDAVGRITEVGTDLKAGQGIETLDLTGKLIIPGLVDAHQHLDKSLTRRRIPNPDGTLLGAVRAFSAYASTLQATELTERGGRTLQRCLDRGTVAVRTHANVDPDLEVRSVEALVALREEWRDRMTVQVVAFVTSGATDAGPDAARWLEEAVALGADAVGGTPAISSVPAKFIDMLFSAASRHGLPIDLHLDEHLEGERQLFDAVIAATRAHGLQGRVTLGHCSALCAMPPADARRVIDGFLDTGIRVITLPAANLFLQGRAHECLAPRGLTLVRELMAAGVPVAAASDNIEDPFIPVGSGDMLEMARWTLLAAGLGTGDLAKAFDMVTQVPAAIMGIEADYGIKAGSRADLVITAGDDAEDLIARGAVAPTVMVGGKIVAGTHEASR